MRAQFIHAGLAIGLVSYGVAAVGLPAIAAVPSRNITELAAKRYSLPIRDTRSACTIYANPGTMQSFGEETTFSTLTVINQQRPGTACNGVFELGIVGVKCTTQEVTFTNPINPATKTPYEKDPAVASKLCSIRPPYDGAMFDLARKQHSLFLEQDRASCSYYADPSTLNVTEKVDLRGDRSITALYLRDDKGGTACRDTFKFFDLSVRCKTNEVSYAEHIGSIPSWKETWESKPEVAAKICALK
jgi:hypothetical protein